MLTRPEIRLDGRKAIGTVEARFARAGADRPARTADVLLDWIS